MKKNLTPPRNPGARIGLRSLFAGLLLSLMTMTAYALPEGYLDVTTLGADPTGVLDSTQAIQQAIQQGMDQRMVVWFPAGTYRVSERLEVDQPDNSAANPGVLRGSTVDPANRATIYLAPQSAGFNDPDNRRAVLHFFNIGTADNESGNTDLYNQAVIGLDFKIGPGNDGAVALRMQGAEGCTIQDVHIDLTEGGHTGIWGIPGSGGSTHGISVRGGRIGIDTRTRILGGAGSQPQPVVTGAVLHGQSDVSVFGTARGSLLLIGCHIVRTTRGPMIRTLRHYDGQPFDASVQIIDSVLEYESSLRAVVFEMSGSIGRSFYMDNVYVRNALRVWADNAAAADNSGWVHFKRLAIHVQPTARPWGQPAEPVFIDGSIHGDSYRDAEVGATPPQGFLATHRIPADFPTWETPGIVDITTLGAVGDGITDNWQILQNAVDEHEMLFIPKGTFMVSDTVELRPDTKIVGGHHSFSVIQARASLEQRFAGNPVEAPDVPVFRSADVAAAQTWLGFFQLKRTYPLAQHNATSLGHYALEWRSGGESIVNMLMVESRPGNNYRPDFAARLFYGLDTDQNPINVFHPQRSFPDGMWAWPAASPNVQVRGNGGGRWYNFWFHGRQHLRENVPFLLVENTREALNFYHLHMQQQDSINHAEIRGSENVTIFGTKGELKGSLVYFENSRNVRLFGNGGLTSPDPDVRPPYLFRFINCDDFLIAGIADTINEGTSRWIGGIFDRWIHANVTLFSPIQDASDSREDVVVPFRFRPILYLRGAPSAVPFTRIDVPTLPTIWETAEEQGDGQRLLSWFGRFRLLSSEWIEHEAHGYCLSSSSSDESIWIWLSDLGWLWTSATVYPFLFDAGSAAWLYYWQQADSSTRAFYRFDEQSPGWFEIEIGSP